MATRLCVSLGGALKRHKAFKHNIDVTWHVCDQEGCDYKSKNTSNLKQHKADVHNIDVTWHVCDQEGCDYKSKQASNLKQHKEFLHDIGTNECECCCKNRNSKNTYLCPTTKETITMCNACFNKATGKHTRKEKDWSDHLDEHLGTDNLLSSDRNLRSVGGCVHRSNPGRHRSRRSALPRRVVVHQPARARRLLHSAGSSATSS